MEREVDRTQRQFRVYTNQQKNCGEKNDRLFLARVGTHLNSSLSSANPEARASTAGSVPMFRRANMAR